MPKRESKRTLHINFSAIELFFKPLFDPFYQYPAKVPRSLHYADTRGENFTSSADIRSANIVLHRMEPELIPGSWNKCTRECFPSFTSS